MGINIGIFTVKGVHEIEEPKGPLDILMIPHQHYLAYPWWSDSTKNILEEISKVDLRGKIVIDFGCGSSAILGIAAKKAGAETVLFVEIHPELAKIAEKNIVTNGLVPIVSPSLAEENKADFMVANIGDENLVNSLKKYATHGIGTKVTGELIRW